MEELKTYIKTWEERFQKCIEEEAAEFLIGLKAHFNNYGGLEGVLRSLTKYTPHSALHSVTKELLKKEIDAILLDAPTTE